MIGCQNKNQLKRKASILFPYASGTGHIAQCFRMQAQLLEVLSSNIPVSHVRAVEWSLDYDSTVAVTACLKKRAQPKILDNIARSTHLPAFAHEQLMETLNLPCWRHMLRVDSKGGIGLYIERDWDPDLLNAVSRWFASPEYLAKRALELVETEMFVVAGVGIHWKSSGETRFRIYNVSIAPRSRWNALASLLTDFIESSVNGFDKSIAGQLLERPRRACVVNLEDCAGQPGVKLEIPDVEWTEISGSSIFGVKKSMRQAIEAYSGSSLRYLGVRFKPGQSPTATLYFPVSEFRSARCGSPI